MNTLHLGLAMPFARAGRGLVNAWEGIRLRLRYQRDLRATRRLIEEMDDHMLSDLGVSRAQAAFELSRPRR